MRRFYLIAALLLASLLLVGFLAWQAHLAVTSHRETAESVLRDYAGLASREFSRRTLAQVGYYGYLPLVTRLRAWSAERPGVGLPLPEELPADSEQERAPALARYLFKYDVAAGSLDVSGNAVVEAEVLEVLEAELERALEQGLPSDGSYVTVFERIGETTHSFVYAPAVVGEVVPKYVVGFETDLSALGDWIQFAVDRGPLLPLSLAGEDFSNDSIFVEARLASGDVIYGSGTPFEPWYGVEEPFGSQYQGVLEEVTVRLAIDPAVASELVIGGLPRSRLPLLLGVLGVVAGLVLIAILQLGRERALVRLRSDFVSRVSHELRTPLTQIRMFAETMSLGRLKSTEEKKRAIAIIDRESRRLSHLVENVLQFSRSEHDSVRLAPELRDLGPLLEEFVDEFNPLLDGRGAEVVTRFTESSNVAVDEDAMRQIVLNLLENAVKYGPPKQEVQLGTSRSNGRVRVWVDDQGPGIRPRDRERIWEPFQRVAAEPGSALTGTGIGLSVVRDLVGRHGGSVWVEDGERGGARFIVELPVEGEEEPRA